MEWAWLLLLGAAIFLAWWIIQRRPERQPDGRSAGNIPPEYLKGLNYVLNEQQDKAIEVFIRLLEVDSDTVDTHLALGHLFRRRGETDRAIRIHQNLIARPALSEDERSLAKMELGLDYMRSGLLDRAESLFRELSHNRKYAVQANAELLSIYQQERDWDAAISTAQHLQTIDGRNQGPIIAQFYCELAEHNRAAGKTALAQEQVRKALNIDPGCIRASLLEAEHALRDGRTGAALLIYQRIEKQDPAYLPEVVAPIISCYRELGQVPDAIQFLKGIVERHGGMTPLLQLTRLIEETGGEKAAISYLSQELKQRPSVRGVDKLVEYVLGMADGEIRDNLQTIKDMTGKLLSSSPVYKCQQCGYDAKQLHWYCPSCRQWSSIKPVFGLAGE